MADQQINFSEILVGPIEQMIEKIGQGIAKAQTSLDKAAIESQKSLLKDFKELADIGYKVNWYHMPEVVVDLKIAMHYEEEKTEGGEKKVGFFMSPFNAKYQNSFAYSADGASSLKIRIVPIPPPAFEIEK